MKLYIRNMVCMRCKMVVKDELTKLELHYRAVELGHADIIENISNEQRDQIKIALLRSGLELMDDKKSVLIEHAKNIIIELVHYSEEPLAIKLSVFLSQELHHDYSYLANLFSEVHGSTIEQFYIARKIECVKELIVHDDLNLTEISYQMHYSSVAHLSAQFKKMTGLTPTHFKKLRDKKRSMLEDA